MTPPAAGAALRPTPSTAAGRERRRAGPGESVRGGGGGGGGREWSWDAGPSAASRARAPVAPRRVSGPAGGVRSARASRLASGVIAVSAAAVALPRPAAPRTVPRPARRPIERPARRAPAKRRPATRSDRPASFAARCAKVAVGVVDHPLLDRLIRGRFWIGLIACALLGIVALQVALLKLNTGIGNADRQVARLQTQNATLRADVSRLVGGARMADAATRLGMVVPAAGALRYLSTGAGDAATAAGRLAAGQLMPTTAASLAGSTNASTSSAAGSTGSTAATGSTSSAGSGVSAGSSAGAAGAAGSTSAAGSTGSTGSTGAGASTGTTGAGSGSAGSGSTGASGGGVGAGGSPGAPAGSGTTSGGGAVYGGVAPGR